MKWERRRTEIFEYERGQFIELVKDFSMNIRRKMPDNEFIDFYFKKLESYEFHEVSQAFQWMIFNRQEKDFPNLAETISAIEELNIGQKKKGVDCSYCDGMGFILVAIDRDNPLYKRAWRCDCQEGMRRWKAVKSIENHAEYPEIKGEVIKTEKEKDNLPF